MTRFFSPSSSKLSGLRQKALFAALLTFFGCGGDPWEESEESTNQAQEAIQGGYRDRADSATVGVGITNESGFFIRACSGALIAPNLVLTAQHCIADTPKFVHCQSSLFAPAVPPLFVYVTLSTSMWDDAAWIPVIDLHTAPGDKRVCGHDLTLLVLGYPIDDVKTPLVPRLDQDVTPGEFYSAIGFGATDGNKKNTGVRHRRDALRILCVGSDCESGSVHEGEWRGDYGICNGDSGGPALDLGRKLIGISSRGPVGCDAPIYSGLWQFKDWLREAGREAADKGNYPPPTWTGAPDARDPSPSREAPDEWSSCALSARTARPSLFALALFALPLLALPLLRRRRRPDRAPDAHLRRGRC